MRAKLITLFGLILFLPISAAFADSIGEVNQLVVFGDSLSDTGNAAFFTGGVIPGPPTNYAVGRVTDGPNTTPATTGPFGLWVDQFAPKINVADPGPGFTPAGGTNYAVATADTGSNSLYFVSDQVALYLSSVGLGKASPAALYTIWAGANDIADGKNPITAADNLYNNILALSGNGAKYFLWFDLPPLGQTPDALKAGPAAIAAGNAASSAFNAEWSADVAKLQSQGIHVIPVYVDLLFDQIESNPSAYGFTNITDSAQGNASVNPNDYLFWDGEHPTTAADALLANLAEQDFLAAPEPANLALAFVGLVLVCAAYRSRQANRFRI